MELGFAGLLVVSVFCLLLAQSGFLQRGFSLRSQGPSSHIETEQCLVVGISEQGNRQIALGCLSLPCGVGYMSTTSVHIVWFPRYRQSGLVVLLAAEAQPRQRTHATQHMLSFMLPFMLPARKTNGTSVWVVVAFW